MFQIKSIGQPTNISGLEIKTMDINKHYAWTVFSIRTAYLKSMPAEVVLWGYPHRLYFDRYNGMFSYFSSNDVEF